MTSRLLIQFFPYLPFTRIIFPLKEKPADLKKKTPAEEAIDINLAKINSFRTRRLLKPLSKDQEERLREILTTLDKNNLLKILLEIQRVLLEED